ncbi:right-handed parallel beta-helix repeat-containing protein [Pseudonocardia spinosispora]|uniref:right-handed parallel beta-helix repeat-containing protein n=1 Tax=Pseudonocardia spinosispora TaxID=103441 RepID=UPI0003F71A2C|nr:right-handed parallel beta-helix repeat-containing protein [Pseudonocardia spinosispora]
MSARHTRLTLFAAVLASSMVLTACGGGDSSSSNTPPPAAQGPAPAPANPEGPGCEKPGTVQVANAADLTAALANAKPGAVIQLADGTYQGNFTGTAKATAGAPITVCGNRAAVIDGGDAVYSFYLNAATYWHLAGFTIKGGQKGVMVDEGQHNVIDGLEISGVGDEGLHLRKNSSDNVVRNNIIHDTGQGQEKFGEGIYIGSAKSNWGKYSGGQPDRSDRNLIEGNTVSKTTSEPVDIKEGTTGGILRNNTFTGPMSDAESWVNVKGNGWQILGNTGHDSEEDGFSVHQILDGWGIDNTFSGNTAVVNGSGYGINVTKNKESNRVTCDNKAEGAAKGLTNGDCV